MPRSVYSVSAGNPIQNRLVPSDPLELEFAYHRGIDNDDKDFTFRVLRELVLVSFVGLVACWLQAFSYDASLVSLILLGVLALVLWRRASPHFIATRGVSMAIIGLAWICHLAIPSLAVEVFIALMATTYLAREVVRHFAFVATVTPTPLEAAWDIRESVCWTTAVSSMLLAPIALAALLPNAQPLLLATAIGCLLMASYHVRSPKAYFNGFCSAIRSWCTYNRDDTPLAGVLISPTGTCRTRLTMLVVGVLLVALALFRITLLTQATGYTHHLGQFVSTSGLFELLFHLSTVALLLAGFALLPVAVLLIAIGIVGIPVFARLAIPEPSFVPAKEWKEITDRIRRSHNSIERDSLYLGRVSFDQSPMLVPSEVFREHAHFLGDSGSGKTARGLAPFIEQIISSGNASVMIIDLKGDSPELLQTLFRGAETAQELTGTTVPVQYFTLRDELATFGFNPFKLACWIGLNDLQKTDILCGALGLNYGSDYGAGYFSSANASVLYATVSHYPNVSNFEQLKEKLAFVVARPKQHGLDDKSRDAGNHVLMSVTRLASISALNITDDFTPNATVLEQSLDPTRLFDHPEAHYFSLSATLGPGSSPEIGRLATYMLLTAATLTERNVPVYLVIDEFQRMASRNLDYLLQLARSMGVAAILANQSMEDLRRYDLTSTLETNCRYRQWFAISGWEDQDRLSKASGETIDTTNSVSVTQSKSDRGTSTSVGHSTNEFIAPRLTKNDVKLVSDEDRKSIVLINRGAGYAQYGGMPVIVESDFHISPAEYKKRKSASWPADDSGAFVPAEWERPQAAVPHRGRRQNTSPPITEETIILGTQPPAEKQAPAKESIKQKPKQKSKRNRRKNRKQAKPVDSEPTATDGMDDPFARYLRENPMSVSDAASQEVEAK